MTALQCTILREISLWADPEDGPRILTPQILADILGQPVADVAAAIRSIKQKKWVTCNDEECLYWVTGTGEEVLEAAKTNSNSHSASEQERWKDEALTGITEKGEPSQIKHGVLPTSKRIYRAENAEERAMRRQHFERAVKQLAGEHGLTRQQVVMCIKDGHIRNCKSCGKMGMHGKRGDGRTRTPCNACRRVVETQKRRRTQ